MYNRNWRNNPEDYCGPRPPYFINSRALTINSRASEIYPDATTDSNNRRVMIPAYDKSGKMDRVYMQDSVGGTSVPYVQRIAYNARGQRLLISMNTDGMTNAAGIMTRYVYDDKNFRLLRMKSEKYALSSTTTTDTYIPQSGTTKQDFAYSYDPLGNILKINDETPNGGIGGTSGLERDFNYDALYRLLQATGRENLPYTSFPAWEDVYRDDTDANTVAYTQQYDYDEMGNITVLKNAASGDNYVRYFNYNSGTPKPNNLLQGMTVGSNNYTYSYDANGYIITENTDRKFGWDYADRMRTFANQVGSGTPTIFTTYLYDASGNRIKKLTQNTGGVWLSVTYIDSIFEYCTDGTDKQNTVHIMDDKARIATERIGEAMGDSTPAIKFILSDHLGSSNVLIDASNAALVNREEYYPFGETSFGSYAKKRYRFCGKEKDEESGLYYYGMRYYMPWTCRFVSVDPLAEKYAHLTPFAYAANKPINHIDLDGAETKGEPTSPVQGGSMNNDVQQSNSTNSATDTSLTQINNADAQITSVSTLKVVGDFKGPLDSKITYGIQAKAIKTSGDKIILTLEAKVRIQDKDGNFKVFNLKFQNEGNFQETTEKLKNTLSKFFSNINPLEGSAKTSVNKGGKESGQGWKTGDVADQVGSVFAIVGGVVAIVAAIAIVSSTGGLAVPAALWAAGLLTTGVTSVSLATVKSIGHLSGHHEVSELPSSYTGVIARPFGEDASMVGDIMEGLVFIKGGKAISDVTPKTLSPTIIKIGDYTGKMGTLESTGQYIYKKWKE